MEKKELKKLLLIGGLFLAFYFIPFENRRISAAILEAFYMLRDYAREHVLLCLIPAFFIAGAISSFIGQGSVIKYLGVEANKIVAYSVAAVSGSILAVCSCTVLPLFSGIYKRGAGLGPATAFLYSGPAINILAIIMTGRVLGMEIGIARAVGAVLFSLVIGVLMQLIFIKEEKNQAEKSAFFVQEEKYPRSSQQTGLYFFSMIAILVFLNWAQDSNSEIWNLIYTYKFIIAGLFFIALLFMLIRWFNKDELKDWLYSSTEFALQIMPLLFAGVLAAGFLLGRPGHQGIIPQQWIAGLVGGNSLFSNLFASVAGAFMYFATLTEIPILQGLMGAGMGKGPALSLLLAGPALSLPNMLVIRSVLGTKKTAVYVLLVVIMATISGIIFGNIIN